MSGATARDARRLITAFTPRDDRDRAARADFLARFDADDAGPVLRDDAPDHLTASCVVFDHDLRRTLLVLHRKGRFWVQPGGHIEPEDASVPAAALRELLEETGIRATVPAGGTAVDLDHHALSAAFGRCASHYDIAIAVVVDGGLMPSVSDESEDVRWWPIDALPAEVPPQLETRVRSLLDRLR